jgi:hypothetical protein
MVGLDAREFVFSDGWWLLLLFVTIGWVSNRRR